MQTRTTKNSIIRTLNKWFRIPQRISSTKLDTKAVIVQETYKNKQILNVFIEVDRVFLNKI